jgi:hypothetical protein
MNAKKLLTGITLASMCGLVLAASQGCTVTVGPGSDIDSGPCGIFGCNDGGADTSTEAAPPPNKCNECLFGQCSGQWAVCQQSTDCMAIYQCATAPNCDQACVNKCFTSSPNGQKAYLSLANCDSAGQCGTCQTACNTPPGQCVTGPDSGAPDAGGVQDCTTCTTNKCSTQKTACAANTDCDQYTQCLAVCKDLSCINACGLAHPQGKTDSKALGDCVSQQCAMPCQL